jgi:hypothetical protein
MQEIAVEKSLGMVSRIRLEVIENKRETADEFGSGERRRGQNRDRRMFESKKRCSLGMASDLGEGAVAGGLFNIDFTNKPRKAND